MDEMDELSCGYCHEIFENQSSLMNHVQENHSETEEQNSSIESETDNESHFDVVFTNTKTNNDTPIDTFECYPCQIPFQNESSLAKHIQEKHSDSEWTCTTCQKSFKFQHRYLLYILLN